MTSTVPESSDADTNIPAGTDSSDIGDRTTLTTDGVIRNAAWFRTVWIAAAAVGLLVVLALAFGALGDNPSDDNLSSDSSSDNTATALSDDSGDEGDEGDIFSLPFATIDGGTGTLADYHGQPLVVNFFASWCPPCRAELPDFELVHQQLGDEVKFVGVNQDFTEQAWKGFVAEATISYDTVFQPQSEIWSEIGTQAMPTTVFISADGEIQQVWAGLITDDKLVEVIDDALLEPTS